MKYSEFDHEVFASFDEKEAIDVVADHLGISHIQAEIVLHHYSYSLWRVSHNLKNAYLPTLAAAT